MTDRTETLDAPLSKAASLTTPTGLQANAELAWRRMLVLRLNVVTYLLLLAIAAEYERLRPWAGRRPRGGASF